MGWTPYLFCCLIRLKIEYRKGRVPIFMASYYLAKLNINEKILAEQEEFEEIKTKLIPNFLCGKEPFTKEMKLYLSKKNNSPKAKLKSIGWKFTDVVCGNDDIIKGNLVKVITKQALDLGPKPHDVTRVVYKEDIVAVNFFYNIESEIFAFKSSTEIPYKSTPSVIENIFKINDLDSRIGEIKVMLKTQNKEITQKLTSGVIKRFELDFIIPNDKKTTDSIADLLLDNGVKSARLKGQNDSGILAKDSNGNLRGLIKEIVGLMEKGYADASFWISKDIDTKRTVKVTSKTMAQKVNVTAKDNSQDIKTKLS